MKKLSLNSLSKLKPRISIYLLKNPDALPSLLPIARCPSYQVFLDTLCTENNIFINKGASEFDFTGLTFKGWLESLIITNGNSYFERVPFFLFRTIDDGKLKTKDWIINHFDNE